MNYPQSTLEEIIDSERAMILDARTRYGRHYTHARETTLYLSHCIESMKDDRADTFGRLFSLLKNTIPSAFSRSYGCTRCRP
jgi:hypothetical protein